MLTAACVPGKYLIRVAVQFSRLLIAVLFVLFSSSAFAVGPDPLADTKAKEAEYVKGEVLVRLRGNSLAAQSFSSGGTAAIFAGVSGTARKLFSLPNESASNTSSIAQAAASGSLDDILVLSVDDTARALEVLSARSEVVWAEPNYLLKTFASANDPFFSTDGSWEQQYDDLWGLKRIRAHDAWDYTRGSGIVVAVVDSGVDWEHPDIAANIWRNSDEIPGNGKDDDNNGYIDDVRGWDFTTCDKYLLGFCIQSKTPDNDPMDENGHGTHVAGTIAAIRNNNIGVVGVAPSAKIMPVRGIGATGAASIDQLAVAVRYAIDNGADVINNSWGGAGESKLLFDVFAYGEQRGVISIAAAGNSDEDVRAIIPAKLESVITVASTDEADRKSSFSNYAGTLRYGPKAVSGIDVAAPGGGNRVSGAGFATHVNILSLRAQNTDIYKDAEGYTAGAFFLSDGTPGGVDKYYRASGTSMAAPHVAGVAALALAKYYADNPGVNRNSNAGRRQAMHEVRARVELTGNLLATNQKNGSDSAVHIGDRRVNALSALTASPRPHLHVLNDALIEIDGNGNGIPESGETVELRFEFLNKWAAATNAILELTPQSSGVTMHAASSTLGAIGTRETRTQATPFSFRANVGAGLKPLQFNLRVTAGMGSRIYAQNIPVTVFIGAKKLTSTVARTAHSFLNLLLPTPVYQPAIDDARVVWTDTRHGSYDVFYYNGATSEELQISNHSGNQGSPDISGDHIVYEDDTSGKTRIVHYTISNGRIQQLPVPPGYADFNHMQPRISGDAVVWTSSQEYPAFSNGANILGYSFKTGSALELTKSTKAQINPDIANDVVVYEDESISGVRLIHSLYNPLSVSNVGPLFSLPLHPKTDGKNIVYTAFSLFTGLNVYTSPVEATSFFLPYSLVTDSVNIKSSPDIAGDHIVWQEQVGSNWDVYFKNTRSGHIERITFSELPDEQPIVSRYYIAWLNDTVLWLGAAPGAAAPPAERPHFTANLPEFKVKIRQNPRTGMVKVVLRNLPADARDGNCKVSFFAVGSNGTESYLGTLQGSDRKQKFGLRKMPGIRSFRTRRAMRRARSAGNDVVRVAAVQSCNGVSLAVSDAQLVRSRFSDKQIPPSRWLKKFAKKLARAN